MFVKADARTALLQGERKKFLDEDWPRICATIQRLGLSPKELLSAAECRPVEGNGHRDSGKEAR
jgi:GntR family transcriptional regulator